MKGEENQDSLDIAQKRLYQRDFSPNNLNRSKLSAKPYEVKTGWGEEGFAASIKPKKKMDKMLFKILGISFAFFLVAIGIAAFVLFGGVNVISDDNIDIQIDGPTSVKAGDEINLQISVTNNNKTALQAADLVIQYPPGTKSSVDSSGSLPIFRQTIGEIKTGEVVNVSSRAVVFGNQNSREQVKVGLEYRLAGSNATYKKSETYEYVIGSSPIEVSVLMPEEVNAGKEFTVSVKTNSNSQTLLKNVLLAVDFPPGFQFRRAEPEPAYGKNVWSLGDVSAGNQREIRLTGVLEGQNEDTKAFKFNLGSQEGGTGEISLRYSDTFKTITLKKPFVALDLQVNESGGESVPVNPNGYVTVKGKWTNNLSEVVKNGRIEVKIDSEILDKFSVNPQDGYYRSSDNTIIWDSSEITEWKEISPGNGGNFSFSFKTLPVSNPGGSVVRNPEINIQASFLGEKESRELTREDIRTDLSRKVKLQTTSQFAARGTYFTGPFTNSGPLPPKADKETTYTIIWSLTNSSSEVTNAKVSAVLPINVKWLNQISPSNENVSYDPTSKRVTWNVGSIPAGVGINQASKTLSFQVALTPSLSQVGSEAQLLKESVFSGYDSFTETEIKRSQNEISTRLSTDPGFTIDMGSVTR